MLRSTQINKTYYSWLLKLILRIGVVIGWTTVVAIFVSRFGVEKLPFLFLIQSVFTIVGMLSFSFLVDRYEVRSLIVASTFLAATSLFLAALFGGNSTLFFVFSIFGYGAFVPQIAIFSSSYIEEFFTPVDCERVAPILESSETIGGIIGGLFLANISSSFSGYRVVFIWTILLFLFLLCLFSFKPKLENPVHHKHHRYNSKVLNKSLKEVAKVPFLQALMLVFIVQWIIAHFLEFQFTRVVDSAVEHSSVAEHEANLTAGLGSLHILLNCSILFVEFVVASRIMRALGTFGGFLLHSIVTFLSFISLFFGFGYFSTILARNNFEITSIVHRNAYEASYWAFHNGTQRAIREFFEAFIMPLAVIAATLMLIVIENVFVEGDDSAVIKLFLIFLASAMIFFSYSLKDSYTELAKELLRSRETHIKMHGVEILSQNGHQDGFNILLSELNKGHEQAVVIKLVRALLKKHKAKAVPHLLKYLKHENLNLKKAVVDALEELKYNKKNN